jgi:hypothetical protein
MLSRSRFLLLPFHGFHAFRFHAFTGGGVSLSQPQGQGFITSQSETQSRQQGSWGRGHASFGSVSMHPPHPGRGEAACL